MGVTSDGKKVYIANPNSGIVSVIDTMTNAVTATIPVGVGPYGIAVTPDSREACVVNQSSLNVSVIGTMEERRQPDSLWHFHSTGTAETKNSQNRAVKLLIAGVLCANPPYIWLIGRQLYQVTRIRPP